MIIEIFGISISIGININTSIDTSIDTSIGTSIGTNIRKHIKIWEFFHYANRLHSACITLQCQSSTHWLKVDKQRKHGWAVETSPLLRGRASLRLRKFESFCFRTHGHLADMVYAQDWKSWECGSSPQVSTNICRYSSVGRASVSKTESRGFESFCRCYILGRRIAAIAGDCKSPVLRLHRFESGRPNNKCFRSSVD